MLCAFFLLSLLVAHAIAVDCFAATNATEDRSAQFADRVDVNFTPEIVENFMNLCLLDSTQLKTYSQIVRKTGESCILDPVHNGATACEARPSTRYGYDVIQQRCVQFQFSGCLGNGNSYTDLLTCQYACEDLCNQPREVGFSQENSSTTACNRGTYYYFDKVTKTCQSFGYLGCGGNRNRFESSIECTETCGGRSITAIGMTGEAGLVGITKRAIAMAPKFDDSIQDFCNNFSNSYPEIVQIIKNLDNTTSSEVETGLLGEFDSMLQAASSSQAPGSARRKRQLISLLLRPLRWARVTKINNAKCREYRITIRIFCMSAVFNGPSTAQRNRLCDLMKQGIKKHWETDIIDSGVTWPVKVTVEEGWLLSKKVILKYYTSAPSNPNVVRSFNPGFPGLPMWMKYRGYMAQSKEDLEFMATAAHELGHDVLMAQGGLVWSWTHEGTSTLFQNPNAQTPLYPPSPQPINLMWYYNGADPSDYDTRLKASQTQIKALVSLATFRFTYFWCPGANGSPCLLDSQCLSGICSWFRCVACDQNSQCAPNGFCFGIFNPFILNHCEPKKANGALCIRDAMCISGKCDGGQCVECKIDSDCPGGSYCKFNNVPMVLNKCTLKHANGALCLTDRECISGMCDGAQCVPCEEDYHCPAGQYCANKDLPLVLNECTAKLTNGGWCTRDAQCVSGRCDGLRCNECSEDSHCPSSQYCKNKDIPLVLNFCDAKKCTGTCNRDAMCKSGNCRWYGLCKKC